MEKISALAARWYEPVLGRLLLGLRQEMSYLIQLAYQQLALEERHASLTYLDCCCGAGGLLHLLPKQLVLPQETFVHRIGLDYNMTMLEEGRRTESKTAQKTLLHWIQGNAVQLPFARQSIEVASISLALHAIDNSEGHAERIVHELCRVAKKVIIADYCLAERNISVPATALVHGVEKLVSGEHYKAYIQFMKHGALEGFLQRLHLVPSERRSALGGAVTVVLLP